MIVRGRVCNLKRYTYDYRACTAIDCIEKAFVLQCPMSEEQSVFTSGSEYNIALYHSPFKSPG